MFVHVYRGEQMCSEDEASVREIETANPQHDELQSAWERDEKKFETHLVASNLHNRNGTQRELTRFSVVIRSPREVAQQ
jgi:hypothetical protein